MNTEVTTAEVNEELSCNNNDDDDDNYTHCPLFMQSLPADFAAHPALAALASLIPTEDDETEAPPVPYVVIQPEAPDEEGVTIPQGGGKVRVPKRRTRRRSEPYPKPPKKPTTTTVGEAQLFLRLWKL
ncbi:hypothetical protein FisN_30Lh024 [Fistulifera solaris]|uniref:Uncharacterized protein n=1 Tax=Fistulifera solaris TaxID=1519565 RepID=A0A1Z5JIA5_FISSO|nr:hypothetical protein FisN_30Lh024 [Fistulifera solaris]|eukprot:GAX13737.1 hypothetical protein FisN_30Lh024 [Fistulifera solaris]